MFSWFRKEQTQHTNDEIYRRVDRLDTALSSLSADVRYVKNHLDAIKSSIEESVKQQMQDIQGRYIKSLEDKLIRFDTEVQDLKSERELERMRMHGYYFS